MKGTLLLLFCLLWLALPSALLETRDAPVGATISVTTVADELNEDGDCSLREAIRAANTDTAVDACPAGNAADTILLPEGTFTLSIPGQAESAAERGDLDITASLVIAGAGADLTVLDADHVDRVFEIFGPASVRLTGLTIRNGDPGLPDATPDAIWDGGGILVGNGATLLLEHAIVTGNSTSADRWGGGMRNDGVALLDHVTLVGNTAAYVGGIRNSGTLTVVNSIVSSNTAVNFAGGILNTGRLYLQESTLSDNVAGTNGGGIYAPSGDVYLTNVTVSGNSASPYGGGIWVYYQAELTLLNSTISNNRAGSGAGIYFMHPDLATDASALQLAVAGEVFVKNTLIADNNGVNCGRSLNAPFFVSLGHNLDSATSCGLSMPTDQSNTDPQLGPLQDNGGPTPTHALLVSSPAVDAGDDTACPPTDQRGVARPQGDACDTGAYEYISGVDADLSLAKTDTPDPLVPGAVLTYTLYVGNSGPITATNITITDILPQGVTYGNAMGSGWSCAHSAGMITCTRASLVVGAAPPVTVVVTAPLSSGNITNTAAVGATTADPDTANNNAFAVCTVIPVFRFYLPLVVSGGL